MCVDEAKTVKREECQHYKWNFLMKDALQKMVVVLMLVCAPKLRGLLGCTNGWWPSQSAIVGLNTSGSVPAEAGTGWKVKRGK